MKKIHEEIQKYNDKVEAFKIFDPNDKCRDAPYGEIA